MSLLKPADIKDAPSSLLRIKLLNADNWYAWKRCMQALLRERGLLSYVDGTTKRPVSATDNPTSAEQIAMMDWDAVHMRAQNQIELSVGDPDMVHLIGAETAGQMWSQLIRVKEMRGELGIMA
ncbi:hypothetical protein CALVIDRAFT_486725, partial [Calocera viscosa TUFC12733]